MMARPVTKIKPPATPFFVAIVRIAIIRIAIVIVTVAMGIIIIAITIAIAIVSIAIAIVSITIATHGNASPQRKTYQKKNPKENQFLIYTIAPLLSSL
jgi:hypothetical protein